MSYRHLSKAGWRVLDRIQNPPKHLRAKTEKLQKLGVPEFMQQELPNVDPKDRFNSVKDWMFMPGDRVLVVRGETSGNITTVREHVSQVNGYLLGENGPTRDVPIPQQFWMDGQKSHMTPVPRTVSRNDLRLVADIDDPDRPGHTKIVAVRGIEFRGSYYDANYKRMMPVRCVAGRPELVIPWPKPEAVKDGDLATDPEQAREQTFWVDSLIQSSIPRAAFSTIRNSKSKFRRGKLTAKDIARLIAPKMPLTDVEKKISQEKIESQNIIKPQLTEEDQVRIGEKILKHFKDKELPLEELMKKI